MTRGVRLYLVGSFVLVSLAGCGRGFFQSAEREPWRAEAEVACLKSGAVKESAGTGPDRPDFRSRRVRRGISAEGRGARRRLEQLRFCRRDLRPPGSIGNQPRWPITQPAAGLPASQTIAQRCELFRDPALRQPNYAAPSNGPISLTAPGVAPQEDEIDLPPEGTGRARRRAIALRRPIRRATATGAVRRRIRSHPRTSAALPRLGPAQGNPVTAVGPVAMKPAATLACPIVSALDRWLADSVQPAAMRWFGARVVEIKQISAYSCRGMNGNPHAHISEHAFGNALDIAAFTLADGRRITVKGGWRGMPEEQGFLRDVQARRLPAVQHRAGAGLQRLSLRSHPRRPDAPRQPPHHLPARRRLRRRGRRARRRAQSLRHARDPYVTGSLGTRKSTMRKHEEDEYADD